MYMVFIIQIITYIDYVNMKIYEQTGVSPYAARELISSGDYETLLSLNEMYFNEQEIEKKNITLAYTDGLIEKGFVTSHASGKDERYYSVPANVVNSIRQNLPVTPVKMTDLTVDEFFDRLGENFEEDDIPFLDRIEMLENLVNSNMHLPYCKAIEKYNLSRIDYLLVNVFASRLINEDDDIIGTHNWEDYMMSKSMVRRVVRSLKNGSSQLIKDGIFENKVDEGMRDPNYYHLTDAAKEALFPDIELVESTEADDKHLTSYTTFSPKHLTLRSMLTR